MKVKTAVAAEMKAPVEKVAKAISYHGVMLHPPGAGLPHFTTDADYECEPGWIVVVPTTTGNFEFTILEPYKDTCYAIKERCQDLGINAETWRFLQRHQRDASNELAAEIREGKHDQQLRYTAKERERANKYFLEEKNWQ